MSLRLVVVDRVDLAHAVQVDRVQWYCHSRGVRVVRCLPCTEQQQEQEQEKDAVVVVVGGADAAAEQLVEQEYEHWSGRQDKVAVWWLGERAAAPDIDLVC